MMNAERQQNDNDPSEGGFIANKSVLKVVKKSVSDAVTKAGQEVLCLTGSCRSKSSFQLEKSA